MSKKFVTEENLGAVVDAIVAAFGRVNGKIEGFDAAIKAAQAAAGEAKEVAEGAKSVADAALPAAQLEGKLAEALGEANIDAVKAKLEQVGKPAEGSHESPAGSPEGSHEGQPAEGHA